MVVLDKLQEKIKERRQGVSNAYHDVCAEPKTFHASEIGNACKKKIYLDRVSKRPPSMTDYQATVFEVGHMFHEYVQNMFGDAQLEAPMELEFPNFKIIGKSDIVVGNKVIELKTCTRLPDQPYKMHQVQLECYLRGHKKPIGLIVYIQKKDFKIREFLVEKSTKRWNEIKKTCEHIVDCLDNRKSPTSNFNQWTCKWCSHRYVCGKS